VDPSSLILDKLEQCLWEEIEEDRKIEIDLQNKMAIFQLGVGGTSLAFQGIEALLEHGGLGVAEFIPAIDLAALVIHGIYGVRDLNEETKKLNEAKQRACSCEQQALNR